MTKANHSEVNYLAIPPGLGAILRQTGFSPYCYYENVRSGPKDWRQRRTFPFYCLLHFLEGECCFADDDHPEPVRLTPGQGLLVLPGCRQEYGAVSGYFVEDSICFVGPTADAFRQAGILRQNIVEIGRERLLLPVINQIRNGTLTAFLQAGVMLQQLLLDLHRNRLRQHVSEPERRLQKLLAQIHKTPGEWWTVKNMAGYCNISENYLRRLFYEQTGQAPKEYLEQFKMRQATELLIGTALSVQEIAARLGYVDPYHFIRRFTVRTGLPPGRYRRAHAQDRAGTLPHA